MDSRDYNCRILDNLVDVLYQNERDVVSGNTVVALSLDFLQWVTVHWSSPDQLRIPSGCHSQSHSSNYLHSNNRKIERLVSIFAKVSNLKLFTSKRLPAKESDHSSIRINIGLLFPFLRNLRLCSVPHNLIFNLDQIKHGIHHISLQRCDYFRTLPDAIESQVSTSSSSDPFSVSLSDFRLWTSLQSIELTHNQINCLDILQMPPSLRELDVRWNAISSLADNNLIHSTAPSHLEKLLLSFNALTDFPPFPSFVCQSLRIIEIRGNLIEHLGSTALSNLPNLNTLDIAYNIIWNTEDLITSLNGCKSLKVLMVDGNPMTCYKSYAERIFESVPNISTIDSFQRRSGHSPTSSITVPTLQSEPYANEVQDNHYSGSHRIRKESTPPINADTSCKQSTADDIEILSSSLRTHLVNPEESRTLVFHDLFKVKMKLDPEDTEQSVQLCLNRLESVYFERNIISLELTNSIDLSALSSFRMFKELTIELIFDTRLTEGKYRLYTFDSVRSLSKFMSTYLNNWTKDHSRHAEGSTTENKDATTVHKNFPNRKDSSTSDIVILEDQHHTEANLLPPISDFTKVLSKLPESESALETSGCSSNATDGSEPDKNSDEEQQVSRLRQVPLNCVLFDVIENAPQECIVYFSSREKLYFCSASASSSKRANELDLSHLESLDLLIAHCSTVGLKMAFEPRTSGEPSIIKWILLPDSKKYDYLMRTFVQSTSATKNLTAGKTYIDLPSKLVMCIKSTHEPGPHYEELIRKYESDGNSVNWPLLFVSKGKIIVGRMSAESVSSLQLKLHICSSTSLNMLTSPILTSKRKCSIILDSKKSPNNNDPQHYTRSSLYFTNLDSLKNCTRIMKLLWEDIHKVPLKICPI